MVNNATGIFFDVGAGNTQLQKVLADSERRVQAAADKVARTKADLKVTANVDQAEQELIRLNNQVDALVSKSGEVSLVPAATAKQAEAMADSMERAERSSRGLLERAVSIGAAFAIIHKATEALKVAGDIGEFVTALKAGDLDASEAAKAQLRKTLVSTTPGALAQQANRVGLQGAIEGFAQDHPNLAQFTPLPQIMAERDKLMQQTGAMTDAEQEAAKVQEENDKKAEAATQKRLDDAGKIIQAIERETLALQHRNEEEGKTHAQREVIEAQRRLDAVRELEQEARRRTTPAVVAQVAELGQAEQGAVDAAKGRLLGDIADTFEKAGEKLAKAINRELDKRVKAEEQAQKVLLSHEREHFGAAKALLATPEPPKSRAEIRGLTELHNIIQRSVSDADEANINATKENTEALKENTKANRDRSIVE